MLFNSYEFLLVYLPLCLLVFSFFAKFRSRTPAIAWLTFASFAFYGYWTPAYLPLFAVSIFGNHALSSWIVRSDSPARKKLLLTLGVVLNLGLLGYFKYAGFFLDTLGVGRGVLGDVILPLGISFYTFHQLAYLVGVYYDPNKHCSLLDYSFYVAFFPQLIAGPITRPHEVLPQIRERGRLGLSEDDFAVGLTIFAIGLVKKVLLADSVAKYANLAFDAAASGDAVPVLTAWVGMLAYTMQLYFDFSGYSDMAIGLARLFGVKLPLNFNAPYQATNISSFWRRWHMTLSRLLRDALYIPLGGNRVGPWRRSFNALAVMTIGGLWHGAGWTFILWGAAHGAFLALNHAWSDLCKRCGWTFPRQSRAWKTFAWALTFLCVSFTWVLFRATSLEAAGNMYSALFGAHDFAPAKIDRTGLFLTLSLMAIAFFAPTTQRIMASASPALDYDAATDEARPLPAFTRLSWSPTILAALAVGAALVICTINLGGVQEFLYFNF